MKKNLNEFSEGNSSPYLKLFSRVNKMVFTIMLMSSVVFAQQGKTITGKVTDSSQSPLPGVSIVVKGTTTGTITNTDGTYSLAVPVTGKTLVYSFVGMKSAEMPIGNQTVINVSLQDETIGVEEVVVVGFGTQKKATLTGSVGQVSSEAFEGRGPTANPMQALQGQVAGVTVTRSSAQPGRENWQFSVRGATSTNNTDPLIVVDGVALSDMSGLNSFNPADIDNISFLKDASAAIYGSRSAGGVVLITTKRSKAGNPTVEYTGTLSLKRLGLKPDLMDIDDWAPSMLEAQISDGQTLNSSPWYTLATVAMEARANGKLYMTQKEWAAWVAANGANTGWVGNIRDFPFYDGTIYDQLWKNTVSKEHQLSISSRNDQSGYRVSAGYLDDGSLLVPGNNSNKRYNIRLSHDYMFSPKFTLQSNISLERNDIVQPTELGWVLNNGIQPGMPLYTPSGRAYGWGGPTVSATNINPYNAAELGGNNKESNTRVNTSFNLTYKLTDHLKAVATLGYNYLNRKTDTKENPIEWYDMSDVFLNVLSASGTRGYFQRFNLQESFYNVNGYLEYSNIFEEKHDVKMMVGSQLERYERVWFLARTTDLVPGAPDALSNTSAVDAASKLQKDDASHNGLAGYFGRLNYAFKSKYLFELNARVDGSSKFSADTRWKAFYGVMGAWRLSEEGFMKQVKPINDLKLRVSYGTVGNQSGIGNYDYIQLLKLNYTAGPTTSSLPIIGTSPVVTVDPNNNVIDLSRTWETVETSNAGLDFTILDNHLSGTFDYFIKRNKNMLIAQVLPQTLGSTAPKSNYGELKTWGWEFSLNWRGKIGKLNYNVGGNISDSQNTLVDYGGPTVLGTSGRNFNAAVEGQPLNCYYGLQYAGRIQSQEQLDAYKPLMVGNNLGFVTTGSTRTTSLQLGDNMFKDISGPNGVPDGLISFPYDAVNLGSDDPRYTYSFNAGLEWKGFDFNVIFQGIGKRTIIRDGNWRIPMSVAFNSQNRSLLNEWWTPDRTDARLPRPSQNSGVNNYNYYPSDWVAENGAYLRLKNLVIGYTIPAAITRKVKIEKLRVSVSGNDLWEISKIKDGWDPETTRTVANTNDSDTGIATYSQRFPFYRNIAFGLNITF